MPTPLIALLPSCIWAVAPIYYRVFMKKFDFMSLNFLRTSLCATVLAIPAIYLGFSGGVLYSLVSGAVTLGLGDSLFLLSIREMGASIAAPVVYVYVLFVQFTASLIGESVPSANYFSAAMVVAGVFLLSRGGEGKPRVKGILLALGAGLAWTAGQDLIGAATGSGANVVSVTFTRNLAGAIVLGLAVIATRRWRKWPRGLSLREFSSITLVAVSDLGLGSLLFVYAIATSGVALTVIITSVSPFLTQLISRFTGHESPSNMDLVGGIVIVAALVVAVAFA